MKIRTVLSLLALLAFLSTSVGGYVYYYSVDLSERWGEGLATGDQIWVQPPGTPTVGMAYLDAYAATGEQYYLDAAREAAEALVYGQLRSGGWANSIDLKGRKLGYRYAGGNRRKAQRQQPAEREQGQQHQAHGGAEQGAEHPQHALVQRLADARQAAEGDDQSGPEGRSPTLGQGDGVGDQHRQRDLEGVFETRGGRDR